MSDQTFLNYCCIHVNVITLCDCEKRKCSIHFASSQLRKDSFYIFLSRLERELDSYIPSHHLQTKTFPSMKNNNKSPKDFLKK